MQKKREKVLKENQEHLAKGGMETESEDEDDDEEEIDLDGDDSGEEMMAPDTKKRKPKKGQFGFDDSDDNNEDFDEDSDYEYTGGDLALFDSRLDNEDELKLVKDVLDSINGANPDYLMHLLSKVE